MAGSRSSTRHLSVKAEGTRSKRRAVVEDSDDEDNEGQHQQPTATPEVDEEEDDDDEGGTPSGQKRSRSNVTGSSVPRDSNGNARRSRTADDDDEEEGEEEEDEKPPTTMQPLPRDKDGFAPGTIVRVKLHNFLTYGGPAEFHPVPHLNLIIGPNGTGKSSIACAIALGLGWKPSILGRAGDVKNFVKEGETNGWTEIELKGRIGEKNTIIRREINAKNDSSSWSINGKAVPQKDVIAKVTSYNIQAENLCSFIPQDKVSEFARMSPRELLVQTERAAGNPNLYEWHMQLNDIATQLERHLTDTKGETTELKQLEDRNRELERDVERWNERLALEREVELYELIVPAVEYSAAKLDYDRLKAELKAMTNKFIALRNRNQPMIDLKTQFEENARALNEQRNQETRKSQKKYQELYKKIEECEDKNAESDKLYNQLESLSNKEKQRKAKINKLKEEITTIEEKLATPPETEDLETIQRDAAGLREEHEQVRQRTDEVQAKAKAHAEVTGAARAQLNAAQQELRDLSNVSMQRLEHLKRNDRDCAAVVEWLRKPENRQRFRMEVTEPAIVSLDVPDLTFVDHIEACISWGQMRTFICACDEDYRLLNRVVNDTSEAIGKKAKITVWYRPERPDTLAPPPASPELLQQLGFDGYALDFVKAPPGLMWYLQKELNMHRTPLARADNRVNQKDAINALSAGGNVTFIAGKTQCRVTRSQYGRKLPQTATGAISQAHNLKFDTVDADQRAALEAAIAECEAKLDLQKAGDEEISQEQKVVQDLQNALKKKRDDIENRKDRRRRILQKYEQDKLKLKEKHTRLAEEEKAPSVDSEKAKVKKAIAEIADKRARLMLQTTNTTREILLLQAASTQTAVRWLQVNANVQALDKMSKTHGAAVARAHAQMEAKKAEFEEVKLESKRKLDIAKAKMNESDESIQQAWRDMQENPPLPTPDEAREELENRKARLETIVVRDPGIIQQFEERQRKIESLTASLASKQRRETQLRRNLQKVKDKWEPALKELVDRVGEKFSKAFDEIGCAGEVRIGRAEHFKEWSIDIFVKFRENTDLQQLTGQRQSGGERSLTTIMYLMSLTEYSRTPFSLVDEINQGMDAKAERVVHNQLVKVTCQQEAGQYFLVTPKLLQNLKYHPRMKVLIVCNGAGLSDEPMTSNLKGIVAQRLANRAAASQ